MRVMLYNDWHKGHFASYITRAFFLQDELFNRTCIFVANMDVRNKAGDKQ